MRSMPRSPIAARGDAVAGQRHQLGLVDAAALEDRHQLLDHVARQIGLAEAILVMLVEAAVLLAERVRDLADRETGTLAQFLELAGGG